MNKTLYSIILFAALLFVCNANAQVKHAPQGETKQLPDCVIIKDGKLQAKAGYTGTISADGKTFTVSKRNNIGATFKCDCSVPNAGTCSFIGSGDAVFCTGRCTCKMTLSDGTAVTYTVDISAGLLRKN